MDRPPTEKPLSLRADLLDPLVSLPWKKCKDVPAGVEGAHAHSVWLNGKLYVGGGDDMFITIGGSSVQLFIYSPSEDSWEVIPTPTTRYALATYHSQLVLVGGCDHTTGKPTSKVWLLEDRSWVPHPTVPDMPVSASRPLSAVGFGDYLILSGSEQDKGSTAMSVFDGQNWLSAQALPEKLDQIKFAVNGDDWYLTGRNRRKNKVYRTSLKSLVASAVSPAVARSAVWARLPDTQYDNSGFTWFGNRLLAVGGKSSSTVYAYNLKSKVWEHVSDLPGDVCSDNCCAVLPPGELLVIGGSKALLKATINVTSSESSSLEIERQQPALFKRSKLISPNDVGDLAEQLHDIAGIWDLFVGLLKVPTPEQDQITLKRDKHPRFAQICLVDGLQHWVVSDPSPTIEKVIAALSSRTINNKLLAAEIARKWGVQVSVDNPALEVQTDCTATSQTEAMCTQQAVGGKHKLSEDSQSLPSSGGLLTAVASSEPSKKVKLEDSTDLTQRA